MEETFKARYIDPMIDWSFKRLFGSEVNKDILIEFLKVIFPEFDIKDITYLPSEQLGIMEKDRRAVFDVICRASDGKEFLVEVQRGAQEHFFERALYYTSFPILKQGKKAMEREEGDPKRPWNFRLDGVFFLGVLNYKHLDDDRIEHRYWLREGTTGETMTDKLKFPALMMKTRRITSIICRRQGTHTTNWSTRRKRGARKDVKKALKSAQEKSQ